MIVDEKEYGIATMVEREDVRPYRFVFDLDLGDMRLVYSGRHQNPNRFREDKKYIFERVNSGAFRYVTDRELGLKVIEAYEKLKIEQQNLASEKHNHPGIFERIFIYFQGKTTKIN